MQSIHTIQSTLPSPMEFELQDQAIAAARYKRLGDGCISLDSYKRRGDE
jgi:hypothetical protein